MKQGEVIVRSVLREDGYWAGVVAVIALMWAVTGGSLTQQAQAVLTLLLLVAGAVLQLTALRRWHTRVLPWTIDGEKLTVGDKTLSLAGIRSVRLERATFVKGSYTLVIRGEDTLRLCSLARGKESGLSLQSLRELGNAVLEQTGWRPDHT